jgi:hypothetical protein
LATTNKNFKVKNGLDVNGEINASAVGGDEGGQINLEKPVTGTDLVGNVSIDIYQNKLRFFDSGGSARGAYIDLSVAGTGVGSNLLEGGSGTSSDSFSTISANGTSVVADSSTDTLTITPGSGLSIVGNATSDTVTFSVDYAEKIYYLVRNNTGSTIPKGTLVSASGAEPSGRIDVAPHSTTGTQDSELRVMGMATANISNGVNGEVISFGTLVGIDTRGDTASAIAVGDETWAEGDILYAHPTVAGKLTKIRPQHDLAVAFITVRHASTGQIAVRIIPGNNHLEWLHDVAIDGTPADNELLTYNSNTATWINQTAEEAGVANLSGATFTGNVAGTHISSSNSISSYVLRASSSYLDTNLLSSTTHGLQIGSTGNSHLRITNSDIQSVFDGSGNGLNINPYGGGVEFGLSGSVPMGLGGNLTITNTGGPTKIPLVIYANATQSVPLSVWSDGVNTLASMSNVGIFTARSIVSTVAVGTPPFSVTSNTTVANLSANLLNGYTISTATPDTIVLRSNIGNFTANTITANLTGTASSATSATQVNTVANTTSATFFPTFVDANNGTTEIENVYTGAGLTFNPSTNTLTTTNVTATLFSGSGAGLTSVPAIVTDDTKPSSPVDGEVWFNSSTGKTYVYYVDADSGQWIEIFGSKDIEDLKARTSTAESDIASIESDIDAFPKSPNYLINGGFDFWQRGTSFTADGYCADRWYFDETGVCAVTRTTTDLPPGFNYALEATATTANDSVDLYQALESSVVIPLRGKTVTFSCYLKMDSDMRSQEFTFRLTADYSTSTDARASQTTSIGDVVIDKSLYADWARASYTFTVPIDAVGLMVGIEPPTTSSPTTSKYFVTGAMLETGSTPTEFRRAGSTISEELAACQRYYEIDFLPIAAGFADGTTTARVVYSYQRKRIPPTLSFAGGADTVRIAMVGVDPQVASTSMAQGGQTSETITSITLTTTGLTSGQGLYMYIGVPDSTKYIEINAEL